MADKKRSDRSNFRKRQASLAADQAAAEQSREVEHDPKVIALYRRLMLEPRFFIEFCLSIVPLEGGEPVPFKLNPGQSLVMDEIERQLDSDEPVRVVVLKSRRQGITTLCEAVAYWMTSTRPNITGLVMAHRKENATDIFRMAKRYYETDSRRQIPGFLPEIMQSNEKALRFDNPDKRTRHIKPGLGSSLLVESSEGTGAGTGMTLQVVHASEAGKWKSPAVWQGVGIALSKLPGTVGMIESTAEGVGNFFHHTWQEAAAGRSLWKPVFLSWKIDPQNSARVSKAERDNWEFQDAEERRIWEAHGLSLEQLKWRRQQIASPDMVRPGVDPVDVFHQEYPLTPDEAFLSSGKNFFLMPSLMALEASGKGTKKPHAVGDLFTPASLNDRKKTDWAPVQPSFRALNHGALHVWEMPQANCDYVIGGDVAEGLEHGDRSIAWVLRRDTLKYVARYKTQNLDPDQFGVQCALLGWLYNEALVGIEHNGPGLAANSALTRIHYKRKWFDRDLGKTGEQATGQYQGWRTTVANRPTMLWRLEEEIRSGTIDMPAADFYDEAKTFHLINGRPEAIVGKHDDEIMSSAITLQLHILGGAIRGSSRKKAKLKESKLTYWKPVEQPKKKASISYSGAW